jgi:hypothetical protein
MVNVLPLLALEIATGALQRSNNHANDNNDIII